MSRSLGSIQLSFHWYSAIIDRIPYVRCAYPSGRLGWGLILAEFNLAIFSCTAKSPN